jgi:site-specific recombinase XerD
MNLSSTHLEIQFFLRKGKNPDYGTVYVRISYGSSRVEIGSLGIRIPAKDWDSRRRLVKPLNPNAEAHNREIDRWRERIDAARLDLLRRGKETITAGSIKAHLLNAQSGPLTLGGVLDWWLSQKEKEVGTRLAKTSYQALARRARSLRDFVAYARLTQQLADEFTPSVADQLVRYLVNEKNHKNASINHVLDVLKAALRAAADAELISRNPLKKYADLPEDDPDLTFLTEEEIDRWEALTDLSPRLEKARDFLLFCIEAGTHYADYKRIREYGRIETEPDGSRWLVSKRKKTGKAIEVPVTQRMERLIEKYGGLAKLPLLANAQLNAFLKVLAERAGITKNVVTKIGRKSFSDARLNKDLLSDTVTATMLGLTSPTYLKQYGAVRREGIKKALDARKQPSRPDSTNSTTEP